MKYLNIIPEFFQYLFGFHWANSKEYKWVETNKEFGIGSYDWTTTKKSMTFKEYITRK